VDSEKILEGRTSTYILHLPGQNIPASLTDRRKNKKEKSRVSDPHSFHPDPDPNPAS
jgi:hypothetical protein